MEGKIENPFRNFRGWLLWLDRKTDCKTRFCSHYQSMGPIQCLLKSVGSSLWLQGKLDRSHGAEHRESFALSACRLRLTTIAAELVPCSNHPCWKEPGDQEADITFRFALGAWWVFVF